MENLNAENIKRGLECCKGSYDCFTCDIYKRGCAGWRDGLAKDALALINSQEQRIKELDDDNARLYYICQSYALQYGTATDKEVFLKKERADTVRKMQKKVLQLFPCDKKFTTISRFTVNQIAKEMLDEG